MMRTALAWTLWVALMLGTLWLTSSAWWHWANVAWRDPERLRAYARERRSCLFLGPENIVWVVRAQMILAALGLLLLLGGFIYGLLVLAGRLPA